LKTIQQKERASGEDPTTIFQYAVQQKLQCSSCKGVKYSSVKQTDLTLPIPLELAQPPLKAPEEKEKDSDRFAREAQSSVPIEACFASFTADEAVNFHCPRCNKATDAIKYVAALFHFNISKAL
jgi:ubiquitin carboxyl-terminal hydrolase 5/13